MVKIFLPIGLLTVPFNFYSLINLPAKHLVRIPMGSNGSINPNTRDGEGVYLIKKGV
jgi:hypothetical protein